MLVKDYMTRHPLMAEPTMSIVEAQRYMGENNIRHLPVVGDGKRLLGLVTRQTARTLSGLTLEDVMTKAEDVITTGPDITIEEAARIMVENKIGCLPVVEKGIVTGIITEIDLLAHLMEMMATRIPGVRVTVRMPNVEGELAKLVGAISAQGWGILACGGAPAPKEPGKWDAVVKIRYVPKEEIVAVLEKVEGQEIVDVREI
jgi:acetoin utilization protein AcuB